MAAPPAQAQAQAEMPAAADALVGRVTDAVLPAVGIAGVTVRVEGTDRVTVTNNDGVFQLAGVGPGAVVLLLEAPGYRTERVLLAADERGRPSALALTWIGAAHVSTTVVATAHTDTASATTVTSRDISAAPHRNAEETLRQVPGLTLVQRGSEGTGHQFFLRGFDAIHGADLELTVDGMPLNEWSNIHAQGYLDLGVVLPETIHAVAVTKGPFLLRQGAFAMAGSADYRLGVPTEDLGWRVAYTAGTTNRHRLFAGYSPSDGDGGQFAGIEATHDDGFGANRRFRRATFNGRVRLLDDARRGSLHLTALAGYAAFALPGTVRNQDVEAERIGFYGTYDSQSEGTSERGLLAVHFEREQGPHKLGISVYGGIRQLDLLENFTGFLIHPDDGDRRAVSADGIVRPCGDARGRASGDPRAAWRNRSAGRCVRTA